MKRAVKSRQDRSVSTSVPVEIVSRVGHLARADDRSTAYIVRLAIQIGIPIIEKQLSERGLILRPRESDERLPSPSSPLANGNANE